MNRDRVYLLPILTLIFLILATVRSSAFSVNPMKAQYDAKPGDTITGEFEATNTATGPQRVKARLMDLDRSLEGDILFPPPGTLERSNAKWMSLTPTQFEIPPMSSVRVKYTATVPEQASGSYYCLVAMELMAEPQKPPSADTQSLSMQISTNLRFAMPVYINVQKDIVSKGGVGTLSVALPVGRELVMYKDVPYLAKMIFENDGNVILYPRGYLEIRTIDGEMVVKKETDKEFKVFPGKKLMLKIPMEKLPDGDYIAVVVQDYGGDSLVAGETRFNIPLPVPPIPEGDNKPKAGGEKKP